MIYLTSDTHFGHSKIIEYTHRPFDTVEEMDKTIIDNINDAVDPEDVLYILGDFTMGGSYTKCMKYREQLNCKHIHLILGNHDKRKVFSSDKPPIFESVKDYAEIEFCCLSHYPFTSWSSKDYGSIMCHGHIHSNRRYNEINQWQKIRKYDVGVDANDYKPVSIDYIINFFNYETNRPNEILQNLVAHQILSSSEAVSIINAYKHVNKERILIAELKTCPFCGGQATAVPALQYSDGRWRPARCGCPECNLWMHGDSSYRRNEFATEHDYKESMKQAVRRWNRRRFM